VYGGWKNYMGHSNQAFGNVYLFVDIGADERRDLPRRTPFSGFDMPFCVHHPGVHRGLSGYGDAWTDNTCVLWRRADPYDLDACDLSGGAQGLRGIVPATGGNRFYSRFAPQVRCGDRRLNLTEWAALGYDVDSVARPLAELTPEMVVEMGRRVLLMR
jgi:hypothetical protein